MAGGSQKTTMPAAKKTTTSPRKNNPVTTASAMQAKSRQALVDENADLRRQIGMNLFDAPLIVWTYCLVEQFQASRKMDETFIFKPKGQAGRGDGYNLYDEMHLSSTATYNMIRVLYFYFIMCILIAFGFRMLFE